MFHQSGFVASGSPGDLMAGYYFEQSIIKLAYAFWFHPVVVEMRGIGFGAIEGAGKTDRFKG